MARLALPARELFGISARLGREIDALQHDPHGLGAVNLALLGGAEGG